MPTKTPAYDEIRRPEWLAEIPPTLVTWLLLAAWSFARVSVPGINEPHYLSKAKHFWNPEWCPGDLFLDSSNPHLVFYATFGAITQWVSLPATAAIGRCLGLLMIAIGWQRLSRSLFVSGCAGRWAGCLAVPFFLVLQTLGNWSGEWVIGGFESRLPAYGCLFWGLGHWIAGNLSCGAAGLGLATAFHPVIGAWGAVIVGMAQLGMMLWATLPPAPPLRQEGDKRDRSGIAPHPTVAQLSLACGWFLLFALPGLLPAFATISAPSVEMSRLADRIQVGSRLKHHLDPLAFRPASHLAFCLQVGGCVLLTRGLKWTHARRFWRGIVLAALACAVAGVLIGWGPRPIANMPGWPWRIRLLKFYPFRVPDALIPVTLSFLVAERLLRASLLGIPEATSDGPQPTKVTPRWIAAGTAAVGGALLLAFSWPYNDGRPSRLPRAHERQLIAAYEWLRDNSPPDALTQALDVDWGLRWFAERAEYVSRKDMPQDAASLVAWNERLWTMNRWKSAAETDGTITAEELARLREQTGIDYLIIQRDVPTIDPERIWQTRPVFENSSFRIERLEE